MANFPFAARQRAALGTGLAAHLMNLPLASIQGAASAGLAAIDRATAMIRLRVKLSEKIPLFSVSIPHRDKVFSLRH